MTTLELSPRELAEILRVVLRMGVLMLRSGAASFRAEQVMTRAALVMGIERMDAYVTPTGIIASVYSGHEHRTQIVRIDSLGVDMNRVCELELLSRNLPGGVTPAQVADRLDGIEDMPPQYPRWLVVLAVGVACGAFALILGGGPLEFAAATAAASPAQVVRMKMLRARFNPLPVTVVCATLATAISYGLLQLLGPTALSLGWPLSPRLGVIASVLLLVPGVPLVTAVLDLTRFDLVAGTARGLYALLLLTCIGIGMLIVLAWTGFSIL